MTNRRDFIKIAGYGADALALSGGLFHTVKAFSSPEKIRKLSVDLIRTPTYCEVCFWKCAGWVYKKKVGIELFLIIHMFMGFFASTQVQIDAARFFLGGPYTVSFWIFVVIMGMILPGILEIMELRKFHIPAILPALLILFVRLKFQKHSALKFVSRTIPPKAEGLIPRSSAAEYVSKACFGVSYP